MHAVGPIVINAIVFAEVAPRFSRIEDLEAALESRSSPTSSLHPTPQSQADPLLTRDPKRVSIYLPGAELISP